MLKFAGMKRDRHANHAKLHVIAVIAVMVTLLLASASEAGAQSRDKENLSVHNIKWSVETFFGVRL